MRFSRVFTLAAALSLGIAGARALPAAPAVDPAAALSGEAAAAFRFAVAKSLAAEGSYAEALAAFDEAEQLAPNDPFVRAEHALLLARISQSSGKASGGLDHAADEIEKARALAPDDLDVLRTAGQVYLTIASRSPEALDRAIAALEEVRRKDPSDLPSMLPLGRIYLDRDEPKKAAEVFSDLVKFVPSSRAATGLLVESLLRSGQLAEAEKALGEILASDPASLESRLTLADLLARRGETAAALETLRAAPESVRSDPQLNRQLASSLYLSGDLDGALAKVDALLASAKTPDEKTDGLLLRLRGLILAAQGRNEEAIEVLGKLARNAPDDLPLALALARSLDRAGKPRDAEKALLGTSETLAAAGKAGPAASARIELASLLADDKDWARVREVLRPLLEPSALGAPVAPSEPNEPGGAKDASLAELREQAVLLSADAAGNAGEPAAGLDLLDRAAATGLAPSAALAGKRAELLLKLGRDAEAKAEVAKLEAGEPPAVIAAAQVYQRLDRYAEAVPILERLTAAHPDLAPAQFLLGAALERSGSREAATAAFRRALALEPDFHAALNYLGYMWAEKGENLDEALTLVRRAVALDPENGAYVDSLGWTHFQLKQFGEARSDLERASRLMPADPTVHEHLGDLYRAVGDVARAREAYRRALELADQKESVEVKRKLAELPKK
ncbi:MAG TPA: tetratricopeptide repeat protein [Thermoanaerobaculia bacterium]|nr:tetratricopeptide repeat protein [Thermoanaerobaculia bacterium]